MIFVPEEEIQQVNYRSEGINGRRLFSRGVGGGGVCLDVFIMGGWGLQ